MMFSNVHFNKVTFLCVFLAMKMMIVEPTISLMEMTFSIVHMVVSAPIQPIAVFSKTKHCSTMILTELLQSHLACYLWFCRKAILATLWFHQTAVIATSTTYDYHLIVFFFCGYNFINWLMYQEKKILYYISFMILLILSMQTLLLLLPFLEYSSYLGLLAFHLAWWSQFLHITPSKFFWKSFCFIVAPAARHHLYPCSFLCVLFG